MSRKEKIKIFKISLMAIVILIAIILVIFLAPVMKNLSTLEGQLAFKNKVSRMGIWGVLLLFGLQLAQIFLIILPGEPMELLAGMCYGGLWGTVFITVTVALTTTLIFFLVRKLGRKFVNDFCEEGKVNKIMNSKLFKNPKKVELIMIILFLVPGTPKDLLVYLGGLLPVKPLKFICISTFVRFPSVISSTLAGAYLVMGNWKLSLMAYAIVLLIVLILLFVVNLFDKNKTTEEVIKTMK